MNVKDLVVYRMCVKQADLKALSGSTRLDFFYVSSSYIFVSGFV